MAMIKGSGWRRPALALVLACAAACGGERAAPDGPEGGLPRGTLVIATDGGRVALDVEIAETVAHQVQGLRFRRHLDADAGMVFLHEEPQPQTFIMEDTLIPLSVAWWDRRGRIVAIEDMEPCTGGVCPDYGPHGLTIGAVEVNQGFFEEHSVEVGDTVRLDR
jgi:uncharacterized protein